MPFYFAYGSNMDATAMRLRAPRSKALGAARLARHCFGLMADGYATIARAPHRDVYGVLYDLALSDVAALDRYEEVSRGLYVKMTQPALRIGGAPTRALVYVGRNPISLSPIFLPGYVESIISAARAANLPKAYVASLQIFDLKTKKR